MEVRKLHKKIHKEINNEFANIFQQKIAKDEENLNKLDEDHKKKLKENQEAVLKQIEEKRARGKGMSQDEFEYNKELLKEIAAQKKELRQTNMSPNMANMSTNKF